MSLFQRICASRAPAAVIVIRPMVGAAFLSEGTQKFLFPADVGGGPLSLDAWIGRKSRPSTAE